MAINGIEFGNKMQIGGGFDTNRIREQREIAMDNAAEAGEADGSSKTFGDFMKDLVQDANTSSLQADVKMQDVAAGRNKDLHGAVLAMEKADVQFRLLTQVRNKVIDAYREILRMQV
ncbi:MAG: flagellar hook-basal body complex protein FliE [Bdellovibrionota bacterium]